MLRGERLGYLANVFVEASTDEVEQARLLDGLEELLVEEAAVHAHDDRRLLAQCVVDQANRPPDHLLGHRAVIAVLLAAPEARVDEVGAPGELEGLEAPDPFVGVADAFAPGGLIVVHDHRAWGPSTTTSGASSFRRQRNSRASTKRKVLRWPMVKP